MASVDGVSTAAHAADFLEQIYAAEAQGKRIVVTDAETVANDGQLAGFSVSWKPESKAWRVFQNIVTGGAYGRNQDQKVILALRTLAEVSFGANPADERHQTIISQLEAGEASKHKNNVVSSFIQKLGLKAEDFSVQPAPGGGRATPSEVESHRVEPAQVGSATTVPTTPVDVGETGGSLAQRRVETGVQREIREQAAVIRQKREDLDVSLEWVWRGFDRAAVVKAHHDNPDSALTPELILAATEELYQSHPEWQNYLTRGAPKPVTERQAFVDYFADPNRSDLGVVAGFSLEKAASAQNVGKVLQALGDARWVNEQVRHIAEDTGKTIDFSTRNDERSEVRNYVRQKLIEHLPKDPNKSVDLEWIEREFKTQFLKAWARGDEQSGQLVAERHSAYSDGLRGRTKVFTERYAQAASDQLDNIIANQTGSKPARRGPGNGDLERLLGVALEKAEQRFGLAISAEDLAEPAFRADFLKSVRHEIKHRELSGEVIPFLRAPTEDDWVDSILVRALASAAAQQLPNALRKAQSSHPEKASGLEKKLAGEVVSAAQVVGNRHGISISIDDFDNSRIREALKSRVIEAQRWTGVDSSQPNRSKTPAWIKSEPGSVLVKALVEIFVPEPEAHSPG